MPTMTPQEALDSMRRALTDTRAFSTDSVKLIQDLCELAASRLVLAEALAAQCFHSQSREDDEERVLEAQRALVRAAGGAE